MPDQPNILMITLDSLRPDHVGCYGYAGTETPHLDQLAADGVRFTNAYCQAPNTWMSHAALFTACNPPRNGVRSPLGRLNPDLPTLAERLKRFGYSTFGLPSVSLLSREAGFARGFDIYPLEGLLSEFHGATHFRELGQTLDLFGKWLAAAPAPWFAWLHYFGIHVAQGELRDGRSSVLDVPRSDLRRFSPFAQHYDAKVAYADREFLGPVLRLARRHSATEPMVALMSDHGDDLHAIETGHPGHDTHLAEQVVRVPLVLYAPERVPVDTVVDTPVRLIDVGPTLLDLVERSSGSTDSADQLDGVSLMPRSGGLADTLPGDVYMENLYQGLLALRRDRFKLVVSRPERSSIYGRHVAWRWHHLANALLPDRLLRPLREQRRRARQRRHFDPSPLSLCRELVDADSRRELFDLANDPDEQNDVASAHPQSVNEMLESIREIASGAAPSSTGYTPEEEAAIHERLEDLGYL